MIYQPPETLTAKELQQLADLSGLPLASMCERLLSSTLTAFRVGGLLLMVDKVGPTLQLAAVVQQRGKGHGLRQVVPALKRLAASWGCTRIETSAADVKTAALVRWLGGKLIEQTFEIGL